MREIKFRAWDKKEHKMIYSFGEPVGNKDSLLCYILAQLKDNSIAIITEGDSYKLKLMQYIGIKDKNGKEIYEGDIIERWDIMPCCGQKKSLGIFEIIWKDCGFYAHNQEYNILGFASNDKRKIIGNIYEDNHLLK